MTRINEEELPLINLFSFEEIQRMALGQMLGVTDMKSFLAEHSIDYKCVLKPNVGLAIYISSVTKNAPATKGS